MPDKEGADDEKKSTKSVVNKKQKQMMGEEGYDIARDMGKVKPSKDKKDATTMPVSDEVKKTQKVNKGPSAFERIKAKYGKSVMKVEELDLTKVAEAFGGHIVEANGDNDKPKFASGSFDPANQEGKFVKNEKKKRLRTDSQKKQDAEISARKKEQVKQRASALDPRRPGFEDEEGQGVGFNAPKSERVPADIAKDMASSRKFSDRQQADMSKLLGNIAGTEGRAKATVKDLSAQQKREKFIAGRKSYTDSKSGLKKGEPTEKGIVDYIAKARDMRQGTNANTKANRKAAEVIAKSSGKEYAQRIRDKYETDKDMSRARGSDQPSFADVKSKIDAESPTVRALMPAGSGKPLPDKTRKKVDKDLGGGSLYRSFKDFLNRSKNKPQSERDKISQTIANNPEDLQTKRIEREAERNKGARSSVEKQSGTKIRDFGLPKNTVTPGNERDDQERQSKPFTSFVDDTERLQQTSKAGALAGFVTKSFVAPASAGIEAAQRYKAGDKKGAAISAIQAMDIPVLSKAAGVYNALRSLRRGKEASLAMSDRIDQNIKKSREPQPKTGSGGPPVTTSGGKVVSGDGGGKKKGDSGKSGGVGMMGGGDLSDLLAANLPKVGERIRRGNLRLPSVKGGRAGTRSAAR